MSVSCFVFLLSKAFYSRALTDVEIDKSTYKITIMTELHLSASIKMKIAPELEIPSCLMPVLSNLGIKSREQVVKEFTYLFAHSVCLRVGV